MSMSMVNLVSVIAEAPLPLSAKKFLRGRGQWTLYVKGSMNRGVQCGGRFFMSVLRN